MRRPGVRKAARVRASVPFPTPDSFPAGHIVAGGDTVAAGRPAAAGPRLLVAVTGSDGAGKTSITGSVLAELRARSVNLALSDRWDIVGDPIGYPTARFLVEDIPLIRTCLTDMSPLSRLLFLLWTMQMSLADRASAAGGALLVDSYWMKHAASEVVYGLDANWVRTACGALPRADEVIYLRVPAELAWQRIGPSANAYECGMDRTCSKASFLRHQQAIQAVLDDWAETGGWTVVDAAGPPDQVRDRVREVVGAVLGRQERT